MDGSGPTQERVMSEAARVLREFGEGWVPKTARGVGFKR
jgi:hypothetical protein